jgi:hypothetical protein
MLNDRCCPPQRCAVLVVTALLTLASACTGVIGSSASGGGGGGGGGSSPRDSGPNKLTPLWQIQQVAHDTSGWATKQAACDSGLTTAITPEYAGWGWRSAAENYTTCYLVAKYLNLDPAVISSYAKKLIAVMKVMARHHFYGTPSPTQEFLAVGDGSKKAFTLRMPVASGNVTAYLTPVSELTLTYNGATTSLPGFYPVITISDHSGGAANYTRGTDYAVSYPGQLDWQSHHPAQGATFYATVANGSFTTATGASASGTTLTFATAPAAGQAVFVSYLGPDYEQSGNYLGGIGSVRPDSGYAMRSMNVGLAEAYDALRDSADFTTDLRKEMYGILNGEVDWYEAYVKTNPYNEGALGNYFVRGHLSAVVFTAFGTDGDNPRAQSGGDLKTLARTLLNKTFSGLKQFVPGGYGAEGSYDDGTNADELRLFDLWKAQQNEDLASQLDWTSNLVPAAIHGTKPDLSFYDGGDWSTLPGTPPATALQAFVLYQPDHAMAPFARQLLSELGKQVAGTATSFRDGAAAFPASYLAKGTGPIYARSDWSPNAVWASLMTGPAFEPGHEHRDRAHFTLQRGADYLVNNSGGYGVTNTLPWHNTLGFDDRGAGDHSVYPPGQGNWDNLTNPVLAKYLDGGGFVYGQDNFTGAYANTDSVTNSVTRAVRTLVLIRPDVVVLHDQAQTTSPNVKKYFNVNLNSATVTRANDTFSSVTGGSKVFMRSLVPSSPQPTILPPGTQAVDAYGTNHGIIGSNYQVMTTGQTADTFLHLFQATDAGAAAMRASAYLKTDDGRAQGAEVDMGTRRWITLFAVSAPQLSGGTLGYTVPLACPCSHVVGDLPPSTRYQVTATGTNTTVTSDANGVIKFDTDGTSVSTVQITPQ